MAAEGRTDVIVAKIFINTKKTSIAPKNFIPPKVWPLYHWPQPTKRKLNTTAKKGFRIFFHSSGFGSGWILIPQLGQIKAFSYCIGVLHEGQNFGIGNNILINKINMLIWIYQKLFPYWFWYSIQASSIHNPV